MFFDNWNIQQQDSKKVFWAAAAIISIIAASNFFIRPHIKHLNASQKYARASDLLIKKNKIVLGNIKLKTLQLQKEKESLAKLQAELFGPQQVKEFFSSINVIANQTGCTIKTLELVLNDMNLNSKNARKTQYIIKNQVKLSIVAGFRNVIAMLNSLQYTKKRISIDSINIEAIKKMPGQLQCDMNISVYVIKNRKESLL